MSVCSNLRAVGLAKLRAVDGEILTFRGATLTAIVNRNVGAGADIGEVQTSLLDASEIEFARSAVSTEPEIGEVFLEGSRYHRIERVLVTDLTYRCLCQQSTP
jgi:hypothetical protein